MFSKKNNFPTFRTVQEDSHSGSYFPTKFFSHGKWEMWEMTKFPMGIPWEISKISKLSKLLDFRCEFMDSVILGNKERPSEHF